MIKIIKEGNLFSPNYEGKKDILICDGRIAAVEDKIDISCKEVDVEVIDGKGKCVFPGFIDCHAHIIGGGGEGGYRTRTPEIELKTIIESGVTTIIGCLGTDGVCRSLKSLIAKAKALKEDGVTCYLYTGSYDVPVRTLTGNIKEDIMLIDEFIGVGEIAISDHRSSAPTYDEVSRLAAEARVAGMLSGKSGIVNLHIGDSVDKLSMINKIVEKTDIPITQFLPTHVNRSGELFEGGITHIKKGGYVDFTTSTTKEFLEEGEVQCSKALRRILDSVGTLDNVSFSSDGQGSMPAFDSKGNFTGLTVGDCRSLYTAVKEAIFEENVPIEVAIKVITSNPARILKLKNKGNIEPGKDADLVLVDEGSLDIDTVISMGKIMVKNKKTIVTDVFGR